MPSTQENIKILQARKAEILRNIKVLLRAKEQSAKNELTPAQMQKASFLMQRLKLLTLTIKKLNDSVKPEVTLADAAITPVAQTALTANLQNRLNALKARTSTPVTTSTQSSTADSLQKRLDALVKTRAPAPVATSVQPNAADSLQKRFDALVKTRAPAPVVTSAQPSAADSLQKRFDALVKTRTPAPVATSAQPIISDDLLTKLDEIKAGSTPLPMAIPESQRAPTRTPTQRNELLAKSIEDHIYRNLHSDANNIERHAQTAVVSYLKLSLISDANCQINRAQELGLITPLEKLTILFRVKELIFLAQAQLKIMEAAEQADPTKKSSLLQEAHKMINSSNLQSEQKKHLNVELKKWVNDSDTKNTIIFKEPLLQPDPRIAQVLGPAPKFDGRLFKAELEAARMQEMIDELKSKPSGRGSLKP